MGASHTRKAIAEAAAQEFVSRGYAGASLSSIAERLGLTKGALTYHFHAKADFATYFIKVVRSATSQADAYAKTEYPHHGAHRLLLYFLVMSSWRESEPRYLAGMALFTDSASPAFESDEIIQDWLALSIDALRSTRDPHSTLSEIEAAELFLIINLGAAFFGRHVRRDDAATKPLHFVRLALSALGVSQVDEYADEVVSRFQEQLPALDYSAVDAR